MRRWSISRVGMDTRVLHPMFWQEVPILGRRDRFSHLPCDVTGNGKYERGMPRCEKVLCIVEICSDGQ